jgi:hypothetical protein
MVVLHSSHTWKQISDVHISHIILSKWDTTARALAMPQLQISLNTRPTKQMVTLCDDNLHVWQRGTEWGILVLIPGVVQAKLSIKWSLARCNERKTGCILLLQCNVEEKSKKILCVINLKTPPSHQIIKNQSPPSHQIIKTLTDGEETWALWWWSETISASFHPHQKTDKKRWPISIASCWGGSIFWNAQNGGDSIGFCREWENMILTAADSFYVATLLLLQTFCISWKVQENYLLRSVMTHTAL